MNHEDVDLPRSSNIAELFQEAHRALFYKDLNPSWLTRQIAGYHLTKREPTYVRAYLERFKI